jgi:hypothetical protein
MFPDCVSPMKCIIRRARFGQSSIPAKPIAARAPPEVLQLVEMAAQKPSAVGGN